MAICILEENDITKVTLPAKFINSMNSNGNFQQYKLIWKIIKKNYYSCEKEG